MKVPAVCLVALAALASKPWSSEAFVVRSIRSDAAFVDVAQPRSPSFVLVSSSSTSLAARAVQSDAPAIGAAPEQHAPHQRRRQFLSQTVKKAVAAFGASAVVISASSVQTAFAAGDTFEDLAMPTEEEPPKKQLSEEEAMAARIRLKAELKKKTSDPKTFTDSLRGEQQKQKEMSKRTKEEQRAALCEELGRGC